MRVVVRRGVRESVIRKTELDDGKNMPSETRQALRSTQIHVVIRGDARGVAHVAPFGAPGVALPVMFQTGVLLSHAVR